MPFIGLSHDKDVIALSEGVTVEGDGPHDDLRVVCESLETRRTIVVPLWEVGEAADFAWDGAALGTEGDSGSINPDILADSDVLDAAPALAVSVSSWFHQHGPEICDVG